MNILRTIEAENP